MKKRLYEILKNSDQFLQDGEKLILEKEGIQTMLFNDGEELSIYEEKIKNEP